MRLMTLASRSPAGIIADILGGDDKDKLQEIEQHHHTSTSQLTRLEEWFSGISAKQGTYKLSHVLAEYVDPEIVKMGWPTRQQATEEAGDVAIDSLDISSSGNRLYDSRVLVVRDRQKVSNLDEIKQNRDIYDELKRCLASAGQELEFQPFYISLPPEITSQADYVCRWLLYLHFITKPDRKTWEYRSSPWVVAKALKLEVPPGTPGPMNEIPTSAGPFSFELLDKNSYSIIDDIALRSNMAIRKIQMEYGPIVENSRESSANRNNLPEIVVPENTDVIDLMRVLKKKPANKSENQVAIEFVGDSGVDYKSLLSQVRKKKFKPFRDSLK